jgi:hypothetical protein
MGLFSFLFGGKKKIAEAKASEPLFTAARAPSLRMASEPVKADPAAISIDAPSESSDAPPRTRGFELTHLKLAYAAAGRAGDAAKAYEAACRLASFYKSLGAKGLSADYRVAADMHFGDWLGQVSRDRRRTALAAVRRRSLQAGSAASLAKTRLAVAAEKLGGPEAARLLVAHSAFLAKLDGPRGRAAA